MAFALLTRQTQTTTPLTAQVQQLLMSHASQFALTGHETYIVHRAEYPHPGAFLRCTRRLVGPQVQAWWHVHPWPRKAPSNVLVVRHVAAPVRPQGAEA